jgi:hypothetical protein
MPWHFRRILMKAPPAGRSNMGTSAAGGVFYDLATLGLAEKRGSAFYPRSHNVVCSADARVAFRVRLAREAADRLRGFRALGWCRVTRTADRRKLSTINCGSSPQRNN